MGALTLTAAKIAPCYTDPGHCEIYQVKLGETVTAGQALYWHTDGTVLIADADDNDKDEAQFVALQGGVAGGIISALRRGPVYGFDLSAGHTGAVVSLFTTAGTFELSSAQDEYVGRVWALPDTTKVIYFDFLVQADIG